MIFKTLVVPYFTISHIFNLSSSFSMVFTLASPRLIFFISSNPLLMALTTCLQALRLHTQIASPTPHVTHSPPSTSIPIDQAPTTNVPQASPTTGVPTNSQASPPELCPSDQDEYPLKTGSKESRRFTRYNHNNLHKQRPNKVKKKITG